MSSLETLVLVSQFEAHFFFLIFIEFGAQSAAEMLSPNLVSTITKASKPNSAVQTIHGSDIKNALVSIPKLFRI